MTPRQLFAWDEIHARNRMAERIEFAKYMRAAQHAEPKDWNPFVSDVESGT